MFSSFYQCQDFYRTWRAPELSYYVSSRFEFRVVMSVTKTMFCSSLPPVVCRSPCLIYVICDCFRIVVAQTFCFVCLRLVYFMLPVSLDCPFWLPLRYSLTFIYHIYHIYSIFNSKFYNNKFQLKVILWIKKRIQCLRFYIHWR
jgi:hypothetical protein